MLLACDQSGEQKETKPKPAIPGVETIADLDSLAVFHFAIMSDNKGDSPENNPENARMVKWIENTNAEFVIGLGDHLKKGWNNSFLDMIQQDEWWNQNFYPNIADGENEFYGEGQFDWCAGGELLKDFGFTDKKNVDIRENGCEYYAQISGDGYIVHLIQLHYPDQPKEDSLAFRETSKEYLRDKLNGISKGEKDIIVVGAHSREGFWIDQLPADLKTLVMEKCDLVLSATTHFFERNIVPGYEDSGALVINTGSVNYPAKYCPGGYVDVHVLENPKRLIVQYINAEIPERELQHKTYAFQKVIGGKIKNLAFRLPRPEEDLDRVIGTLSKNYTQEEMTAIADSLYISATNADEAFVGVGSGLEKGDVAYKELWTVFPYDNEIYVITMSAEQVQEIFGERIPIQGRDTLKVAINGFNGKYIVAQLELSNDKVFESGITEIPLLEEWIKSRSQ
jgi:hypothetical protein